MLSQYESTFGSWFLFYFQKTFKRVLMQIIFTIKCFKFNWFLEEIFFWVTFLTSQTIDLFRLFLISKNNLFFPGNLWSCFHGNGGRRHNEKLENEMDWILNYKDAITDSVKILI